MHSLLWLALIGLVLLPWVAGTWKPSTRWFAFLCSSSGALWWALLLWAAHNLTFQLASICTPRRGSEPPAGRRVPVAILYTTCDDFSEDALRTCVLQRRSYEEATVYVLDDSRDESLRLRVRRTCEILGCMYISREAAIRDGLKLGI